MKIRVLALITLITILLLSLPMNTYADAPNLEEIFEKKVHQTADGYKLNYRLYLPDDYSTDKKYPVILFFHGAGEKENDNTKQLRAGLPNMFTYSNGKVQECIVIAPQCPLLTPDTAKWVNVPNWVDGCSYSTESIPESEHMKAVVDLLGVIRSDYSTDESRWYVTGLSMGGFATWDIIVRHPEIWAAAAPLCGGADYRKAEVVKDLPIWTFHGTADPTVPYTGTEKMVNALKELGSTTIKYTPMDNFQHNIWSAVYSNPLLYSWMFAQVKPAAAVDSNTETQPEATETVANDSAEATDTQTDTTPVEEKGCGSAVGIGAAAVMATAGVAVLATRKKED